MIWNTVSVVNQSPVFNNDGIDKATSIICEINEATNDILGKGIWDKRVLR